MMDLATYDLVAAGASIERIPGRMGFGGSVRATFPHKDSGKPGILISGHLDTVHLDWHSLKCCPGGSRKVSVTGRASWT